IVGFDKQVWSAETVDSDEGIGVKMSLVSPDGDEGYPGEVAVTVTFLLNNSNELAIHYFAEANQTTPLSLTNHTYFNLTGFQDTIENHQVQIQADTFLQPDETNVPVGGIASVADTPADLRSEQRLGDALSQLKTGFEHFYCFNPSDSIQTVAKFSDPASKIGLEVATTEPGILFYTGYFTSDELQRENGDQYGRFRGFCCETSRYPNGPNLVDSPGSLTSPGTPYHSATVFKLTTI
ncbi:MAG: galactose mutarotase, partial [Bacteroidota bacterium]